MPEIASLLKLIPRGTDCSLAPLRARAVALTAALLSSCARTELDGPSSDQFETVGYYLLAGMSNMAGRGATSSLAADLQRPRDDVPYCFSVDPGGSSDWTALAPSGGVHGAEITFGATLAEDRGVGILKWTRGGAQLGADWLSGARNYEVARNYFRDQLASKPIPGRPAGIFWIGGSLDAGDAEAASSLGINLTELVARFREDFGPDLPFLFLLLPAGLEKPYRDVARRGMATFAQDVPGVFPVDIDDQVLAGDGVHLPSEALQVLGERAARIVSCLSSEDPPCAPPF